MFRHILLHENVNIVWKPNLKSNSDLAEIFLEVNRSLHSSSKVICFAGCAKELIF